MEAVLYDKHNNGDVTCELCAHTCRIKQGKSGICGVRKNSNGLLKTRVYGKLIARSIDPIEKKPLYHVYPGTRSYSIATVGCNFRCRFCQNADIAQLPRDNRLLSGNGEIPGTLAEPDEIVSDALQNSCKTIAYTYTEPTIFFEYALETAKLADKQGIKNVFVTNGYMSEKALTMITPYLHAANVDLKSYSNDFYHTYCGAKLEPVKETLIRMKHNGIFVEVTTLLIPGLNDSDTELNQLADFIKNKLGSDTPWHISRFHPTYKLTDKPATSVHSLQKAREIGLKTGLNYVYTGNIPGDTGENTYCPECKKVIIKRWGFKILENNMDHGTCGFCGSKIDGAGF